MLIVGPCPPTPRRLARVSTALLLALAWPSTGKAADEPLPLRSSTLVVYGNDPCPKGTDDEIVVCARRPESERYRIPRTLRGKGGAPTETSWASRVEGLDEAARASRPNSCSVVGSGGQTGCLEQMLRAWFGERRSGR